MSRKSKEQRINEANELILKIKADPILAQEQQWLVRFLEDMKNKFSCGRDGTPKQRDLFDQKINEGIPQRKIVPSYTPQETVKLGEEALSTLRQNLSLYDWEYRVCSELVAKGLKSELSNKQIVLLSKIIQTAASYKEQLESTTVDDARIKEAKLLINLADCYTQLTPKKVKAVDIVRSAIESELAITDQQFANLEDAVKGQKKKYDHWKKKIVEGTLVKTHLYIPEQGYSLQTVLIIGQIEFKRVTKLFKRQLTPIVPVLCGDKVYEISPDNIIFYTKKELKDVE